MGLLDDAIREHLDLKRKHGADPGEISRLEREALSPPTREPLAPESSPDPASGNGDHEHASHEPAGESALGHEPNHQNEAPASHEVVDQPTQAMPAADPFDADHETPAADPASRRPEPPATEPSSRPAERDPADDIFADDPEPEQPPEEDVLEETPEFLQETPEHDRLWFEQKPPKDFDFDG